MFRLMLVTLLCLAATLRVQGAPLGLRMPERIPERVDQALERAVHAELGLPDAPKFGESQFASGGTPGGTHILIGSALMVGSFWLLAGLSDEGNFFDAIIPIAAPVFFIGGAVEVVYGIVKVVKDWNSGFK